MAEEKKEISEKEKNEIILKTAQAALDYIKEIKQDAQKIAESQEEYTYNPDREIV